MDGTDNPQIIAMRYNHYIKRVHTTLMSILSEEQKITKRNKYLAALKNEAQQDTDQKFDDRLSIISNQKGDETSMRKTGKNASFSQNGDESVLFRNNNKSLENTVFMTAAANGENNKTINNEENPNDEEQEINKKEEKKTEEKILPMSELSSPKDQKYILEVYFF